MCAPDDIEALRDARRVLTPQVSDLPVVPVRSLQLLPVDGGLGAGETLRQFDVFVLDLFGLSPPQGLVSGEPRAHGHRVSAASASDRDVLQGGCLFSVQATCCN